MTKVKIEKKGKSIRVIECDGHTNYGASGEDIVCSALSSIVQTGLLGLLTVAKINPITECNEKKGYLKITIPDNLSPERQHDADIITNTVLLGISDLHEGFSDFIELEVK